MKNKKICWITPDYFADCDIPIVPNLLEHFEIHWVIVLTPNPRFKESDFDQYKKLPGLTIEILLLNRRFRDPRSISDYLKISKIIKRVSPDMVYMNMIPSSPWQIPMFLSLPKEKTIITAHQGRVHEGMKYKAAFKFIRNLAYGRLKNVNMFSKSQAALFQKDYPNSNIWQFPLGLKYFGEPTNSRPCDGIVRFLSFGIINYTKNIDLLINAANLLYERGVTNFRVSINGSCKDWSWYAGQIKYPQLFDLDIRMIDNSEIPNLFNGSHYLVQPYRVVSQSGPTKVAFQYNLPVICSNLPGFTDEVIEGINGYYFEVGNVVSLADQMEKCINCQSEYQKLLESEAKNTELLYSQESLLKQYCSMFFSVLHG